MRTRVQKWGDSLVVRIPKAFADEIGLDLDKEVVPTLSGGKLLLASVPQSVMILETLLADITPDNLHAEVDSDEPVGNEMW